MPESELSFRVLGPADRAQAATIADKAFAGNPFYEDALGFDAKSFSSYWDAFLSLVLADPGARVFGAEAGGDLGAVLVVAYHGFPEPLRGFRFLVSLLSGIGVRRSLHYLRFVAAYERAMRRPKTDEAREARGLWLMSKPVASHPRIGSALVRFAIGRSAEEGKTLCTGFVDAGNRPLLAFYRRSGFRIGPRFEFSGRWAATVARDGGATA
jgi:ribosomal protein S18 acetylase RimI-like enzyme